MAVSDWSTSAAGNGTVLGINIAENCGAANVNNGLREALAQLAAQLQPWIPIVASVASKQDADATLTALAGLPTAANKGVYFTGLDTAGLYDLSALGRTLSASADAAAACNTLGAVRVAALSLANPGYVKFQVGAAPLYFMIAWGTFTANANTTTAVNYAASFPTASFPLVNAGRTNAGAQDNDPFAQGGTATTSGFTVYSPSDTANSGYYISVGY
jgi:hypothetical protein